MRTRTLGIMMLLGVACFWTGRLTAKPIIKTVVQEKEIKVYDFTQTPEAMEIYANLLGKTLSDKKEIEKVRHEIWQEGYQDGYKEKIR